MKKIVFSILASVLLFSCTTNKNHEKVVPKQSEAYTLVTEITEVNTQQLNQTKKYSGNITAWQSDSNELSIFLNTQEGRELVSLMRVDKKIENLDEITEVLFLQHAIVLKGENAYIYGAVDNAQGIAVREHLPSEIFKNIQQEVAGGGLSWHKIPKDSPLYEKVNVEVLKTQTSPVDYLVNEIENGNGER